jgi:tetratricopeptide (TPR) repeat protein
MNARDARPHPAFRAAAQAALAAALAAALVAAPARASGPSELPSPSMTVSAPDLRAIWDDPGFRRSFVGGYGISAEVEPRVSPDDIALLELVRQLMPDDLPAAEALLRDSVRADGSAVIDLTLAGVQFQQERLDDALANYRESVAKFPSFRRAYRNIGLICTRQGKFDDAIAAFNRMIELGSADAYAYGLLGYCHTQKTDFQPAEAAYRNALLLQPANVEWRLGLTRSVFKQGKYEDAASLLDVLVAAYPDKADFWLLQAHTFLGLKQPMRAAENLEAMDAIGRSTVDSLYTLGDVYLAESLHDLALRAFERAVRKSAGQGAGRAVRSAEMLSFKGGMPQARALLASIRESYGDRLGDADRRKVLKLQARLAMAGGAGDDEAAKVLTEVIESDPLDGEALMLLGQHHARKGEPDQAILMYERAARVDGFAAQAKVKIAQIYVGQSRFGDALPLLRDAQSIKPREDVARYIEQVERASRAKR